MKRGAVVGLLFFIYFPALVGAEETTPPVALGGGGFMHYLHLNLNHWRDARGERLPRQDLLFSGGRVFAGGPWRDRAIRWRLGGFLGWAGNSGDDIDELQLGMVAGGITSGLTWRPEKFGLSVDLNLGGSGIVTEFKREELEDDWDRYERRDTSLFFLEPLLGLDWLVSDIFSIRLQAGYTFLWGRGEEVGGFTGGVAFELGRWL